MIYEARLPAYARSGEMSMAEKKRNEMGEQEQEVSGSQLRKALHRNRYENIKAKKENAEKKKVLARILSHQRIHRKIRKG